MTRKKSSDRAERIRAAADAYFLECQGQPLLDREGEAVLDRQGQPIFLHTHPPTVTGLALALGFRDKEELLSCQGGGAEADAVLRARLRVEEHCERQLFDKDGYRGAEFSLRHNFQWGEQEKRSQEGGVILMPEVREGSEGSPQEEPWQDGEERSL